MESTTRLQTMQPTKLFLTYLIPSLLGMVLMSINILVDGLFVSHGVGEHALAGVNIAMPIYSILLSISLWIGMGGATMYSIAIGKNEPQQARKIFTQSVILALGLVATIIALCLIFQKEVAYLFGANDTIYPYVHDYLHVILVFGLVFIGENILSIFVRNDGNPFLATTALVTTSVINIILNYIFIFHFGWGVKGAAYATVIGTIIGFIVLLAHFFTKNSTLALVKTKFQPAIMRQVLAIGLPSFIVEGSFAIIIIAYNITFSHFVGDLGITAFAVINYVHSVYIMVFIGIGAALQPITSYHFGAKLYERLNKFVRIAVFTGFIIGVLSFISGFFGHHIIVQLFGIQDPAVIAYLEKGIRLFFIGYLFLGINMVYAEFYQSIEKIRPAIVIIVMRSLVLFLPLLWILPTFFGTDAIWLAFPIAEGITCLSIFIFKLWQRRSNGAMHLARK